MKQSQEHPACQVYIPEEHVMRNDITACKRYMAGVASGSGSMVTRVYVGAVDQTAARTWRGHLKIALYCFSTTAKT